MDEEKAAAYYDEQRARGAAAARQRQGLGFKPQTAGHGEKSPAATPAYAQPQPYMMPQPLFTPPPGMGYSMQRSPAQTSASPWTAHRSGDLVYYFNSVTGTSQWERPVGYFGPVLAPSETPKPVASERIPNTVWTEVKCEDGRVYYYNMVTKGTVWNVPLEVQKARNPAALVAPNPAPAPTVQKPETTTAEIKRGRKATAEEVRHFKSLLSDSGVTAYSRFEKEAARLGEEPRWQEVSLERERRSLFDAFCREKAQEEITLRGPSTVDQKKGFEALLLEARETEAGSLEGPFCSVLFGGNASLKGLETTCGQDPRWKGCAAELRERLFQEFKRRYPFEAPSEDEESENGSSQMGTKLSRSDDVVSQPDEREPPSQGGAEKVDPREGSATEKQKRARMEEDVRESRRRFRAATHEAAVSDYRTLLSEVVKQPDVRWDDICAKLTSDIQGRGVHPDLAASERRRLFEEHVERLHDTAVGDYRRLLEERLSRAAETAPWRSFEATEELLADEGGAIPLSYNSKFVVLSSGCHITSCLRRRLWRAFVTDDVTAARNSRR